MAGPWFRSLVILIDCVQSAKDIQTPEGILEVQVLEATEVPSMDWIGQSDPFVKYDASPNADATRGCAQRALPYWPLKCCEYPIFWAAWA